MRLHPVRGPFVAWLPGRHGQSRRGGYARQRVHWSSRPRAARCARPGAGQYGGSSAGARVSLLGTCRGLGSAVRLHPPRAERIVQQAMPHAVAASGRQSESLPVRATCVSAEQARGGSVIPAWPVSEPDGGVVIEYVADWGALLSAWLSIVG